MLADRQYLRSVMLLGFLLRITLVAIFVATDAIYRLRLSPDSERYHRVGLEIMEQMHRGNFNWINWVDNGWFQFTGFVYYLFGPYSLLMQLWNIALSTATIAVVYELAKEVTRSSAVARSSALLVALMPSFVYWSCLMLKDTTAIFAVSVLVLATVNLRYRFSFTWLATAVSCLMILLCLREYMFFVCTVLMAGSLCLYLPGRLSWWSAGLTLILLGWFPALFGYGWFGLDAFRSSHYFDLDYINHVRVAMGDHGSGAIFEHDSVATWGQGSVLDQAWALTKTVLLFFVSVNPLDVGSLRQWMALPEALLVLALIPALIRGLQILWADRQNALPLLVFAFGITLILVLATTNIGALFRWRMQVMPLFVIALSLGVFASRHSFFRPLFSRLAGVQS